LIDVRRKRKETSLSNPPSERKGKKRKGWAMEVGRNGVELVVRGEGGKKEDNHHFLTGK